MNPHDTWDLEAMAWVDILVFGGEGKAKGKNKEKEINDNCILYWEDNLPFWTGWDGRWKVEGETTLANHEGQRGVVSFPRRKNKQEDELLQRGTGPKLGIWGTAILSTLSCWGFMIRCTSTVAHDLARAQSLLILQKCCKRHQLRTPPKTSRFEMICLAITLPLVSLGKELPGHATYLRGAE